MFDHLSQFLTPGFLAIQTYFFGKIAGAFLPAFLIAGALATFVPRSAVLSTLGVNASPWRSYPAALFSGGILSVCACGILPLFQSIAQRGAGLGPSITFLFAGPAINVIAILYTFDLLGARLGVARLLWVTGISLVLGFAFSRLKAPEQAEGQSSDEPKIRLLGRREALWPRVLIAVLLALLTLLLPTQWLPPGQKWPLVGVISILVTWLGMQKLSAKLREEWLSKTWSLLKSIVPKLLLGIFIVGLLEKQASRYLVGYASDGFLGCLLAATLSGLMYFGTIVGVVFVHGLVQMGLSEGPALSILLAGPSVCLPSLLVIQKTIGWSRTLIYFILVVLLSACAGKIHACDLNHDWKLTAVQTRVDMQPHLFQALLDQALRIIPGRLMLLEVRDTYRKRGYFSEGSQDLSEVSTETTMELERILFQGNGKRYSTAASYLSTGADIFASATLRDLAVRASVDAFVKIRLRSYGTVEIREQDQYKHNAHVFRDTRDHFMEFSLALIGPGGEYLDFLDMSPRLPESMVVQKIPDQEPVKITESVLNPDTLELETKEYFLGLEQVQAAGMAFAAFSLQ